MPMESPLYVFDGNSASFCVIPVDERVFHDLGDEIGGKFARDV